jgi:DNA-directed RNA polymerase alpha subunit
MKIENINNFNRNAEPRAPEILVADCDTSLRIINSLESLGIKKLSEVAEYTEEELAKKIPQFGHKMIEEISELLISHNLNFKS